MNNIDFISLYHSYINKYSPKIKLQNKRLINTIEKRKLFDYFIRSPFISNNFKEKIEIKISKSKIYQYTYGLDLYQGRVNFHFISDLKLKVINKLKKYYFFIIYLQQQSGKENRFFNDVFINIIPIDTPKKITIPINIDSINSASTVMYPPIFGGPIFIWRKDELEKVLVHETLHSILYDDDIIKQKLNNILSKLETHIDKNGKGLNINEAYTELCATFIMSLFKLGKKKLTKTESKLKLSNILKKVLTYSFKTCGKLFAKYDVKKANQCTNVENLSECKYHQEASAFSYIIIKTALLWALMKRCKIKVRRSTDKIQCIEDFLSMGFTSSIGYTYQDLIVRILCSGKFNKEINKYIKKTRGRPPTFYFTIFH